MSHARNSDPISSHLTVRSLTNNDSMFNLVCAVFNSTDQPLSDTDITHYLQSKYGYVQRNVIARIRLRVQDAGYIDCDGVYESPNWGRKLLHFKRTSAMPDIQIDDMVVDPKQTYSDSGSLYGY